MKVYSQATNRITPPSLMKITATKVKQAVKLINCGLSSGLGSPEPGKMCIEAVWCKVLGLPHGDDPKCVTPYLRRLKIRLNDSKWSSNEARAKGMLKLGIAQVGSLGVLDEEEFRSRVATMTRRTMVPIALRAAASVQKKKEHVEALEKAASALESDPSVENCKKASSASADAASDAAAYAAYAASDAAAYAADAADASDAAYAASDAAAYASDAAAYAAYAADAAAADAAYAADASDAAAAYAYASAASADASAKRDEVLTRFADEVLAILIDMKAPGCKWLYLCE